MKNNNISKNKTKKDKLYFIVLYGTIDNHKKVIIPEDDIENIIFEREEKSPNGKIEKLYFLKLKDGNELPSLIDDDIHKEFVNKRGELK